MPNDRQAIAMELKQIIQADRMAVDVIQRAKDMGASIEKQTEKDKAAILAEAEQQRRETTEKVQAELADELARRKAEAEKEFAGQREFVSKTMEQNKDKWVEEITARILGSDTAM